MRVILTLLLFSFIPLKSFAASCLPPPPAAFAQGCYNGDGNSSQTITTNIANPGMLIVSPMTNSPNASYWRSPDMAAGISCGMANGSPQCPTTAITSVSGCGFTVGSTLNINTQTYCWYEAQNDPLVHSTFVYTGNGSNPRTIGLTFTPDICTIQLAQGNSGGFANSFYFRTQDMPANTSYVLSSGLSTHSTVVITSLTTNGFVVNSAANENGKVYRGFCFKGAAAYGEKLHWLGNGTGFDTGCANEGNVQTITTSAGGTVKWVLVGGCTEEFPSGCDGATCTLHLGAQGGWRGVNIGNTVLGPGHIAGSDFYEQSVTQPDVSQIGGMSGNVGNFTVRGAGSFGASLNDNLGNYYGFAITTPTTISPSCP
jgi:hypothetical protein